MGSIHAPLRLDERVRALLEQSKVMGKGSEVQGELAGINCTLLGATSGRGFTLSNESWLSPIHPRQPAQLTGDMVMGA